MGFSYGEMMYAISILKDLGYEVGSIGTSTLNRDIPYVFIGKDKKRCGLVTASIHAREMITTPLVLSLIRYYTGNSGIYIVPMVNPDGVEICNNGVANLGRVVGDYLLKVNDNNRDFALWKANARAVDLNVNFDVDWGTGAQNVNYPSPSNYIGEYPNSEVEVNNLIRFTNKINPLATISYHTKGEVIYYGYKDYPSYFNEAKLFSDLTGYALLQSEYSAGGYKDYYVSKYGRLGMTFEVGESSLNYPIPISALQGMIQKNKEVYNLLDKVLWTKNL